MVAGCSCNGWIQGVHAPCGDAEVKRIVILNDFFMEPRRST